MYFNCLLLLDWDSRWFHSKPTETRTRSTFASLWQAIAQFTSALANQEFSVGGSSKFGKRWGQRIDNPKMKSG